MDVTVGGIGGMKQGYYAMADTLCIGGMAWINVPFYVVDLQTGHAEADRLGKDLQLPPVVGLPILLRMQEIQLDFARREFVIPAVPTPSPLRESNMIRTDSECLQVKVADETGASLYWVPITPICSRPGMDATGKKWKPWAFRIRSVRRE